MFVVCLQARCEKLRRAMDKFRAAFTLHGCRADDGRPHLSSFFGCCIGILTMCENVINFAEKIGDFIPLQIRKEKKTITRSLWSTMVCWGVAVSKFWCFQISALKPSHLKNLLWHSNKLQYAWWDNPILWNQLQYFIAIIATASLAWFVMPIQTLFEYPSGFFEGTTIFEI